MKQPRTSKLAFIVKEDKIIEKEYLFDFYGGFSLSQKQKTIDAFHQTIENDGIDNILEISRKSKHPIGNALSAFNLTLTIHNQAYPIECIYQSSKVFNDNIQFKEALKMSPLEAKKLIKEQVDTQKLILSRFDCFNIDFPLYPKSFFYDYIYVMALSQNRAIVSELIQYNCFTDVEFNHKKQFASQARSCAIFKYLYIHNMIEQALENIDVFKNIYKEVFISNELNLDIYYGKA